ncbi:hypothetical protein JKP88DRAFT_201167 [Tribonema minus]|uniref:Uncharacterized protein n=1 Tax=Tribonema minus TaxID=303371 RepID=A0A835YSB5_9STRA|nr:hypothetical protein JKP88DRAFT_201167 [Tribonema minus]
MPSLPLHRPSKRHHRRSSRSLKGASGQSAGACTRLCIACGVVVLGLYVGTRFIQSTLKPRQQAPTVPAGQQSGKQQQQAPGSQQYTRHDGAASDGPEVPLHPNTAAVTVAPGSGQQHIVEASRGEMDCSAVKRGHNADKISNIAYWRDVPSDNQRPPELLAVEKLGPERKYVTFEADTAGWNNKRMGMEAVLIFASLTGRTLVMPPEQRIYQLNHDRAAANARLDFSDFFPLERVTALHRLSVITTEEFLAREGAQNAGSTLRIELSKAASELSAVEAARLLEKVAGAWGEAALPLVRPGRQGYVLPFEAGGRVNLTDPRYADGDVERWLAGRELLEYTPEMQAAPIIHWRARESRLLTHFYTFARHSAPAVDRYHKRLMRDLMHYRDEMFCKASQVVSLVRGEAPGSVFSSFHIRRGDFNLEKQRMTAEDMLASVEEYLRPGELVFIATDERDKSFFEPMRRVYEIRFLDDYWQTAALDELSNKNYVPMVDSIVASHGRTFTGTWFSTFTSYILRMRGYLEYPRTSNWHFQPSKRKHAHGDQQPRPPFWMTEWNQCWDNIDNA